MAEKTKESLKTNPVAWLIAVVMVAFLINYACLSWFGRPYLYCWFSDAAFAVWDPYQLFIVLVAVGGVIIGVAFKNRNLWVTALLIIAGAFILPDWLRILFTLGRDCGG